MFYGVRQAVDLEALISIFDLWSFRSLEQGEIVCLTLLSDLIKL